MKTILKTTAFLFVLISISGCRQPGTNGSIRLNIRESLSSRVLEPGLDIITASYRLTGLGPNGASFDQTTSAGNVTLDFLEMGDWTVTVEALNTGGELFAAGAASTYVGMGVTTPLTVSIRLLEGQGALELAVEWQEGDVQTPELNAFIRSGSGVDAGLNFQSVTPPAGKQRMEANTGNIIDEGYYTLVLQVRDKGASGTENHLAFGAVEVARILAGQTTTGFYDLKGIPGQGSIGVNIIRNFDRLIDVTIENAGSLPASLAYDSGATFTANAAIPGNDADAGAVTYVWYLNGQSVGLGASYTVDMASSPLHQTVNGTYVSGHYRLDLTAFSTDGSRGGSTFFEFDVTGDPVATPSPSPTPTETPSPEPTISPTPVLIATLTPTPTPTISPSPVPTPPPIPGETKITASGWAPIDGFGYSVDLSGDGLTMLIGAPRDSFDGENTGTAYLYQWDGTSWIQTEITASVRSQYDWFGCSVALAPDGQNMLIGAYEDDRSGSAYHCRWNGSAWIQTRISPSDENNYDRFGYSVAIADDGETILSGSYGDDDNGSNSGSAYLYQKSGSSWIETKITPSDGGQYDNFGNSVAISGDGQTMLIGAYHDSDIANASGSAYLYQWNGSLWDETKIIPPDGAEGDNFGRSVAIAGDGRTILVGADFDDDNGANSGSAYLYQWNGSTWTPAKITASDMVQYARFGCSVDLSQDGGTMLIGAYGDDDYGNYTGSAYLYRWNGSSWDETKITAFDGEEYDYFGWSAAIAGDGRTALIGAYEENESGPEAGAVYLYE